jgi:solute carrier family 10 (sodium/bile acid cotransporter), member 7
MAKFLKKNLFLVLIICVIVFSMILPGPGLYVKKIGLLTTFTFIAMFLSGLTLSFSNITASLKDYKSIIFSVIMAFVVFPVLAYFLCKGVFHASTDIFVGAMIISTQASTVTSAIVLTMAANGNVPLAIIITIINNTVSAFVTPMILNFLLSMDQKVSFNVTDMIVSLITVLIVPVILAQLCKIFLKKIVALIMPWRKLIANFVVLMFVLIGASTAAPQISSHLQDVFLILLFVIVLHIIALAICLLYSYFAKLPTEKIPSVMFCSSEKTMTTSTMVWGNYFPQYVIAPIVIVSYHVCQIFIDSIIANSFAKKNSQLSGIGGK